MAPAFGGTSARGVVNVPRPAAKRFDAPSTRERGERERERETEREFSSHFGSRAKLQVLQQMSPHGTSRRAISGLKLQALAADFSACQQ